MKSSKTGFRPMRVVVRAGSPAEKRARRRAFIHGALAPGLPKTPRHDLRFHGGKTIPHVTYRSFYLGGAKAWAPSDRQQIDGAIADAMTEPRLINVLTQYFPHQTVTASPQASVVVTGALPATVDEDFIQATARKLFNKGKLAGVPLATTVFNFLLPSGTVLTDDTAGEAKSQGKTRHARAVPVEEEASSLAGLGGYHGSVHVRTKDGGQVTIYYSAIVFSEMLPDGSENGIVAFDSPWKNVVATLYHELCEAMTDPDVADAIRAGDSPTAEAFLGWTSRQGEEIGDFPIFEAGSRLGLVFKEVKSSNGGAKVPVQFQYSNAVHGPEGPIAHAH